jgi:hypothetical protein
MDSASSATESKVGIPNPGVVASCPPTTSPKKGCREGVGGCACLRGLVTGFLREEDAVSSALDAVLFLVPVALRAVAGDTGAGCGLSLGFRLLNLCGPYDVSFGTRAGGDVVWVSDTDRLDGAARTGGCRVDDGEDSVEEGWLNFCARLLTVGRLPGS